MARDSEKTEKGDTAAKDVRLTEHSVCVCVCACVRVCICFIKYDKSELSYSTPGLEGCFFFTATIS